MNSHQWKVKIKSGAKGDLRKVLKIQFRQTFEEIKATLETDPYKSTQSFEKLVPPAAGYYSRRLNLQHRVVYTINKKDKIVEIYSCWSHYENGSIDMSGKSGSHKN
ncbi:putative Addiction module toxin [Oenococcus oeni]|uniref:Txe/YoeB family addiction module toxin n=2 Tax=Oenococcus oeni TaxID=1247 RepID=UPI00107C2031|nr:Txe/YoeB family addiction module toxin [Oenococcus oeni]AVI94944.1 addiction module protein [Oenococcus oeni]SYV98571.1 putative Addiction module toxin [Oenococcus oeni]SYW19032.1 putative Addiction module toxin [Oenococcus oeni]VDC15587.1 putative Addiction module toxin [Oenococcus oeni]